MATETLPKKIKIAWFASSFIGRNASGTAQVARKIITNLIENHSDEFQVLLLVKNNHEEELLNREQIFTSAQIVRMPNVIGKRMKSSRQFYKFCIFYRNLEIDILHFSVARVYPFYWLFPAKKIVCTFHAGGDITAPRDLFVASREIYNLIIKKQWKKFDAIIADSNFASNEISEAYRIPIKFIKIVYLGSDNLWSISNRRYERDPNLVVIVGRWQIYKNLHTVVNAFKKLEIPNNKNLNIFVIGKGGPKEVELKLDALSNFPKDQIKIIEYLPDSELAEIYQRASVVFHPSINEGFGLPAFEAFGEGARLIAHAGTPAHEILASQSGVIFDNLLDEKRVIESYKSILLQNFGDIAERRTFIESISATWAQSTEKYSEIYKKLMND
jgi:glycosyltransferase involved in cell wall biosynthesis